MDTWKIVLALILTFVLGGLLGIKLYVSLLFFNAQIKLEREELKLFLQYILIIFKE